MKTHLPYITCMSTSLKESIDQFVSSSSIKSRLDNSLSNCENELICKCFSDGKVIVENFNREGYLLSMKEDEGFRYVSCAFGMISNRRLVILARSDNKLIVLLEGLFDNLRVFNQIEIITIPSSSNITSIDVNQFRSCNSMMMNSILVGCYDGSLHVFNLILSNQDQALVATHQQFPNYEGYKSIGILKIKEEPLMVLQGNSNFHTSILYVARTDGIVQVCRLTTRRTIENVTSEIETLKCIVTNSCICALSFCDLIIERETVKVIAVSGIDFFTMYYSHDNFTSFGKINIQLLKPQRIVTSILSLRLERDNKDLLSLLFGDDLGQLYRVKITDLKVSTITIEPKNLLDTPLSKSMVIQSILVRRSSEKTSILFTTRLDETQEF